MAPLTIVAWISVAVAVLCAAIIAADILRGRRQHMTIMNFVWPLTALYAGPLALWAYFRVGLQSTEQRMQQDDRAQKQQKPFWQSVALGATHCGSGCTLGDLIVETFVFFVPISLFGKTIFGAWALDYVAAFALGIAFQYFTIKPMRDVSVREGLKEAVKADTASLTAWQIGMYGWMAIVVFVIFGHELPKNEPLFWFMMQIAMLFGFLTAFPVNWWLIRAGIKERM